jgi:hypothetical protein
MQQRFLAIAAKQTGAWIDSAREDGAFDARRLAELGRDSMENFVRSQKKFLDVVAEEAAHATDAPDAKPAAARRAEIAELAREGAEAFIDAEKKLLDIAAQQMAVQARAARKAADAINPLTPAALTELTRRTVESFVAAQKALLDVTERRGEAAQHLKAPPQRKARKGTAHEPAPVSA